DVGQGPDAAEGYPLCPSCGYDRQGLKPMDPCPECGFVGVPPPQRFRRSPWRGFVRRSGFILLAAGGVVSMFTPQIAIPALIVAVVMIFWEAGEKKGTVTRAVGRSTP